MVGDDDGLQGFSTKMGIVEGEISTLKSTLNSVIQELKRLSLKTDDQSLADGMYRSGSDHLSTDLFPPPPPLNPPQ